MSLTPLQSHVTAISSGALYSEKRYMLLHFPSASLGTGVQDRFQGGVFQQTVAIVKMAYSMLLFIRWDRR